MLKCEKAFDRVVFNQLKLNTRTIGPSMVKDGNRFEVDALAYSTERREAYVVKLSGNCDAEDLECLLLQIADFPTFFRDFADYKIFGILAATNISAELRAEILSKGLYLARLDGETFKLQVPRNFKPRAFSLVTNDASNDLQRNGKKDKQAKKKR